MKAKKSAFLKRKACVMKKTMELSILCDVKACAIIFDEDGSVETWPKSPTHVKPVLDHYTQKHSSTKDILMKLNTKIEAVKKRIDFLKGKSIRNCVGDGEGEEFSEILKEIIGTDQEIDEQRHCPLEYYWDGEIEQKPCPEAYYWDGGDNHNVNNHNYSADSNLLLREDFWSDTIFGQY